MKIGKNSAFVDASRCFVQAFDLAGFAAFLKDVGAREGNNHD